jgi:hypothetical protein
LEKSRARGRELSELGLVECELLANVDDAIVDVDKAGLVERVDDAVDTTPDGLEGAHFDCRVPTRSTVATGGVYFAFNLPVFADDTSREVFKLMGVFVMIGEPRCDVR